MCNMQMHATCTCTHATSHTMQLNMPHVHARLTKCNIACTHGCSLKHMQQKHTLQHALQQALQHAMQHNMPYNKPCNMPCNIPLTSNVLQHLHTHTYKLTLPSKVLRTIDADLGGYSKPIGPIGRHGPASLPHGDLKQKQATV